MATRSIVTSHPDVACDVCGRRLLRGEHADVFLAGGQRRMVCELCVPRAAHEGWLRESEGGALTLRPAGARRQRSLLGRLRQLRESSLDARGGENGGAESPPIALHGEETEDPYGFLDAESDRAAPVPAVAHALDVGETEPELARALGVFNGSEHPRRVAGVARSLGAPWVCVTRTAEAQRLVTVVVAWDLCWYRYEIDLDDEAAGARLVAQGTELHELAEHERAANAAAGERGELALLP